MLHIKHLFFCSQEKSKTAILDEFDLHKMVSGDHYVSEPERHVLLLSGRWSTHVRHLRHRRKTSIINVFPSLFPEHNSMFCFPFEITGLVTYFDVSTVSVLQGIIQITARATEGSQLSVHTCCGLLPTKRDNDASHL